MKAGDRVFIKYNPFCRDDEGILGEVVAFRPGVGFMGCDIADVKYVDTDGDTQVMPFGTVNLNAGCPEELIETAHRLEEQAQKLREMAFELTQV